MSRLTIAASLLLAIPSSLFAQQIPAYSASNDTGPAADEIFETKDAAALTVGLAPLSKSQLPNGGREVRIWYSGFGNPQYLVIIRQTGTVTTGRLLLRWDQYYEISPATADTRVDNFVRSEYDCGPISTGWPSCPRSSHTLSRKRRPLRRLWIRPIARTGESQSSGSQARVMASRTTTPR